MDCRGLTQRSGVGFTKGEIAGEESAKSAARSVAARAGGAYDIEWIFRRGGDDAPQIAAARMRRLRQRAAMISALRRLLPAVPLLAATAVAAPDDPQAFLPPVAPWHGASERLAAAADDPWITPSEKTGLADTPGYDDTIAWLKKLSAAAPQIKLVVFGRTAEGRPLYAAVASKEGAADARTLRRNGRPTVLAQAGIHSGEIDGKDAGLMLLRDLALRGQAPLLERANFILVPVFNADGHERSSAWNRPNQRGPVHQGWRTTAQNLNLNRDYLKADAPEMRAMLRLIADWRPSLYLDLHVTDGIDYQYDITFGYNGDAGVPAWSPHIAGWLNAHFRPEVTDALKTAGHVPGPLVFAVDDRDLSAGLSAGVAGPRFSQGYGDLRHLPAILVENHSLKPYRRRVLGTYVLLAAALRAAGAHAEELRAAIAADAAARPATLAVNWGAPGGPTTTVDFLGVAYEAYVSPASGAKEVRWTGVPKTYAGLKVALDRHTVDLARPKAYWVPGFKPEVIERLRLHGVRMETLAQPRTVAVEMYRLQNAAVAHRVNEGRVPPGPAVAPRREARTETFPAGSVRVPADQPLGELAMALLEPECDESLYAWGFFPEILQRTEYIEGYVIAPLAEKLLADDPKLKAEFEAKLAAEPAFAADPTARLQWFYARTKFFDDRWLLYPIGVER